MTNELGMSEVIPMKIQGTKDIGRRAGSFLISLSTINIEVGYHKVQTSDISRSFPEKHMFHKHEDGNHARITKPPWCDVCGRIVNQSEIIKGYEIGKDRWVYFTDDELKSITSEFASKTFQMLGVTPMDHRPKPEEVLDTYVLDPASQKRKKDDEMNAKLYALLADKLQTGSLYIIGKMFSSRGGEVFAAITGEMVGGVPYLYMYSLYYADELRNPESVGLTVPSISVKEKELMSKLVDKELKSVDYQVISSQLKDVFEKLVSTRGEGELPPEVPTPAIPVETSAESALEKALAMAAPNDGSLYGASAHKWKRVMSRYPIGHPIARPSKSSYQVIVGNVGTVYDGVDESEAEKTYNDYVELSKSGYGRAGNEDVSLMRDGEPLKEHFGRHDEEDYSSGGPDDLGRYLARAKVLVDWYDRNVESLPMKTCRVRELQEFMVGNSDYMNDVHIEAVREPHAYWDSRRESKRISRFMKFIKRIDGDHWINFGDAVMYLQGGFGEDDAPDDEVQTSSSKEELERWGATDDGDGDFTRGKSHKGTILVGVLAVVVIAAFIYIRSRTDGQGNFFIGG